MHPLGDFCEAEVTRGSYVFARRNRRKGRLTFRAWTSATSLNHSRYMPT